MTSAGGRLPNLFVLGAPRAGTTALYRFLEQHPDVFMCDPKEPHHFCTGGQPPDFRGPGDDLVNGTWVADRSEYLALFGAADAATVVGEASTGYLSCEEAPDAIHDAVGDGARLVAVLRDPVDRAWSAFQYLRREGYEPCGDFLAAVDREPERIEQGWSPIWRYVAQGRYGEQVARYRDTFPPASMHLVRYEDLRADPERVLLDLYVFLGLRPVHLPDVRVRHNVSGTIRRPWLHRLLTGDHAVKRIAKRLAPPAVRDAAVRLGTWNIASADAPSAAERAALLPAFRDDIARLENVTGWDLTAWREPS